MLASKATQLRPKPPISALFARRPHINVGVAEQCYKISTPQATEEQLDAARKWLASLPEKPLPTDIGEVSYSRSSGPGGQNVNKVNSKAQLRVSLDRLLPHVPTILHQGIRSSRYYTEKNASLLIQSDDSRKQTTNRETCYRKLHQLLLELGQDVPGETSEEQKARVKALKHRENEARLKLKKLVSSKKSARSKSFDHW